MVPRPPTLSPGMDERNVAEPGRDYFNLTPRAPCASNSSLRIWQVQPSQVSLNHLSAQHFRRQISTILRAINFLDHQRTISSVLLQPQKSCLHMLCLANSNTTRYCSRCRRITLHCQCTWNFPLIQQMLQKQTRHCTLANPIVLCFS